MPRTTPRNDWAQDLDGLNAGDRHALLRLTRLVNGFFSRWNAYDFRDDWDDLIQEVLIAALKAHREGRIRERGHTYGFVKTIARNKFVDRLKEHLRLPREKSLPWEEEIELSADVSENPPVNPELNHDLEAALASLDEKRRSCVLAVYIEGKTHSEAALSTGIPVGSVRRYLREGLLELRTRLGGGFGSTLLENTGSEEER